MEKFLKVLAYIAFCICLFGFFVTVVFMKALIDRTIKERRREKKKILRLAG